MICTVAVAIPVAAVYCYYYYCYGHMCTFAVNLQNHVRPTVPYNSPYHIWEMQ